jgi:3-oxoacyl-(acyl-carrier-protein) synthase
MEPAVIGHAEVTAADPAGFSANKPSFFADPLAWMVVAAIERALGGIPMEPAMTDETGVLVMRDTGALPTSRVIARQAQRGQVSPLRFAGSNPGILAGLSCIRWELRGPSLVLTGAFAKVAGAGLTVARRWLADGHARHVVCAGYQEGPEGHTVRCVILGAAGGGRTRDDALGLLLGPSGVT